MTHIRSLKQHPGGEKCLQVSRPPSVAEALYETGVTPIGLSAGCATVRSQRRVAELADAQRRRVAKSSENAVEPITISAHA